MFEVLRNGALRGGDPAKLVVDAVFRWDGLNVRLGVTGKEDVDIGALFVPVAGVLRAGPLLVFFRFDLCFFDS